VQYDLWDVNKKWLEDSELQKTGKKHSGFVLFVTSVVVICYTEYNDPLPCWMLSPVLTGSTLLCILSEGHSNLYEDGDHSDAMWVLSCLTVVGV